MIGLPAQAALRMVPLDSYTMMSVHVIPEMCNSSSASLLTPVNALATASEVLMHMSERSVFDAWQVTLVVREICPPTPMISLRVCWQEIECASLDELRTSPNVPSTTQFPLPSSVILTTPGTL
jgi:hypothetical protein